jgi:hypothetical protein
MASPTNPANNARAQQLTSLLENPFVVLELLPTATSMEVERQGKKLLMMLEAGIQGAETVLTVAGPRPRTAEQVRKAMAQLFDPAQRLRAEPFATLWHAGGGPRSASDDAFNDPAHDDARGLNAELGSSAQGFAGAFAALPWWRSA